MMITSTIKQAAHAALSHFYPDQAFTAEQIGVNQTKPEFAGDYTVVFKNAAAKT
jgi:arginyl-tRNA synthetase